MDDPTTAPIPWYESVWNAIKDFFVGNWQTIVTILLVAIFGFILIKLVMRFLKRAFKKSRLGETAGGFLIALIKAVLYILYLITLLALLGVPMTSMIAILSACALAVSLALQDTISNLASGIVLVCTKPFVKGDYIAVDGVEGTVEDISIFNTHLITVDNKRVVIPNNRAVSNDVTNYSVMPTRRVDIPIGVAYGTDPDKLREIVLKVATSHQLVLADPEPVFKLKEYASSSINFTLRVWVKNADYWTVTFDLNEQILAALNENGIVIPFNQLDVHIDNADANKQ